MEPTRVASQAFEGIPELVRRPLRGFAQLVRRVREAADDIRRQLVEVATLTLRLLDGVALQATRMRARSDVEVAFGPLTVSFASGVILARDGSEVPA